MKKIISLGLAFVMVAMALVSCKNNKQNPDDTKKDPIPSLNSTEKPTQPESPSQSETETVPGPAEIVFEDCDEKVYVVNTENGLKLRKSPSFDNDNNVGTYADPGQELRRIGYNEVWSKVVFENKEYYAATKYLSTEKPSNSTETEAEVKFQDVDETVYIKTGTEEGTANIYSKPSKKYLITDMPLPTEGTAVKRTGIAYDKENDPEGLGWSRIIYKDKVCYIRNSVVSLKTPSEKA